MRRCIIALLLAAAVIPAAALAANPDAAKSASNDCTALQAKMGATAFAQAYSSFGACVSVFASLEQQNQASANTSCTALQADTNFAASHQGKTFVQFYGTGKNGANAFNHCVSALAKASSQTEQQGRLNPAQTCRTSKAQMTALAFNQLWGTKTSHYANASGKCVSSTAKAQSQNELSASATCQAALKADSKAFALAWGPNGESNAFGKCVSTTASGKSTSQQQATVSAAKFCLAAEKTAGLSSFMTTYGTFGHCVSLKASGK